MPEPGSSGWKDSAALREGSSPLSQGRIVSYSIGGLGILMLWAVFWVVPRIETRLESAVSVALEERGFHVSSISARGTSVTVVGGPTSPESRLALAATIRNVPGVSQVRSLLLSEDESPSAAPTRLAEADPGPGALEPGRTVDAGGRRSAEREGPLASDPGRSPSAGPEAPRAAPEVEAEAPPEAESESDGEEPSDAGPRPPSDTVAAPDEAEPEEVGDSSDTSTATVPSPTGSADVASEASPPPCRVRLMRLAEGRTLVFNEGSSTLSEADQAVLGELVRALRSCGEWTLTIVGFASASEGRNAWRLADRRAYGVARFLLDRGIDESRIATVSGNTPSDEEGSPRVELFVSGGE